MLQPRGGSSGGASGGPSDGAVTSIDVSRTSDFLICGYSSGKVSLWDIMAGVELKVCRCVPVRACRERSHTCTRSVTADVDIGLSPSLVCCTAGG